MTQRASTSASAFMRNLMLEDSKVLGGTAATGVPEAGAGQDFSQLY